MSRTLAIDLPISSELSALSEKIGAVPSGTNLSLNADELKLVQKAVALYVAHEEDRALADLEHEADMNSENEL